MKSKWISINDKLPDFDTDVLLFWHDGHDYYEIGYLIEIKTRKSSEGIMNYPEWNFNECYGDNRPTHWMPLPTPPQK